MFQDLSVNVVYHLLYGSKIIRSTSELHSFPHDFSIILSGANLSENVILPRLNEVWYRNTSSYHCPHSLLREGDRLLSSSGDTSSIEHINFGSRIVVWDIFRDVRIKSSTAAHEYFVDFLAWCVPAIVVYDILSSYIGHGCNEIV